MFPALSSGAFITLPYLLLPCPFFMGKKNHAARETTYEVISVWFIKMKNQRSSQLPVIQFGC